MVETIHLAVTNIFHVFTIVTGSWSYYTVWIVQVHRANYSIIMHLEWVWRKPRDTGIVEKA